MNRGPVKKVVVTGLGLATSLGLDLEGTWGSLLAGVSGIRRLTHPEYLNSPIQAAGTVTDSDWRTIQNTFPDSAASEGERRTLFALWAGRAAMTNAGLKPLHGFNGRYGVCLAAGLGINCMEDIQRWTGSNRQFDYAKFGREYDQVSSESAIRNNANRPAALIADQFGFSGSNCTITTACSSATQAIGTGFRAIQRGDADMILAGGSDSMINPLGLMTFVLLGAAAVSSEDPATICRPFDRRRSGLVVGEGAGVVLLEEESHALQRGARIYAEVAGYGTSMDAYQVTAPHPKGAGAEAAMQRALKDASLSAADIDYINAHGTGTKLNDATETLAIRRVFQEHSASVAISSSKSMIGHLMAAAGGPEFIFTVLSVCRNEIHPTINLKSPDPKCDLDYVPNEKRTRTVRAALSNSFGFGGQNASIALKKYVGQKEP
jgi:3-oxoacyl-[acyl-carrier-protein] synthase II